MTINLNILLTLITEKLLIKKEELELYDETVDFLLSEKVSFEEKERIKKEKYSLYDDKFYKLISQYLLDIYPPFIEIKEKLMEADYDRTFLLLEKLNKMFPPQYTLEPIPSNYELRMKEPQKIKIL